MLLSEREDLQCFSEVLEIENEPVNPCVDFSKSKSVKFSRTSAVLLLL